MSHNIKKVLPIIEGRTSILELSGSVAHLTLRIQSRMAPKQRRMIAVTFLKQIRPWLSYFQGAKLTHLGEGYLPNFARDQNQALLLRQFPGIQTSESQFGFEVRMQRLKMGLSQEKLAAMIKTSPCRISLIERGMVQMRKSTMQKIQRVLWSE